jgi:hypothetical protein
MTPGHPGSTGRQRLTSLTEGTETMISMRAIAAAIGCALLMSASAVAEEPSVQPSIQAGQWQCGTSKDSKTGYQCDVITFSPGFGGNPKVYLSLSKMDLSGSGSMVLESISLNVAQVSWSGFQPAVDAKGWTDSTRSKEIDAHQLGNWGGTWIAIGPPLTEERKR